MKGSYHIVIENKKIRYEFDIKRNITIFRGDSATGKTLLVDLIRSYYDRGSSSGVTITCDRKCRVVEGADWELIIKNTFDSIVFIDETNKFLRSKHFAHVIKNTSNYYVLITREDLSTLPYSVDEIYGIRESGKYRGINKTYNEMYRI